MNASSTRASVPGLFPLSQGQPRNSNNHGNNAAFEVRAHSNMSRNLVASTGPHGLEAAAPAPPPRPRTKRRRSGAEAEHAPEGRFVTPNP